MDARTLPVLALFACGLSEPGEPAALTAPTQPLEPVISADTQLTIAYTSAMDGEIEPCG